MQNETKHGPTAKVRQFPIHKLNRAASFLLRCGLSIDDLERRLSVIHVSGTKGKGSTCAYCDAILKACGFRTGLFTSPHLTTVRERIRINGTPLSQERFASLFWCLHRQHDRTATEQYDHGTPDYFAFLTAMALRAFVEERVDVAILEVGIGGEYDTTNVFRNTAVVGITSLGYDHVDLLGSTIEEIAWQKAGIIKRGSVIVCSSDQPVAALKIIVQRASERQASALFVAPHLCEYVVRGNELKLGIAGPAQASNASLAVQLANAWMKPAFYRAVSRTDDVDCGTCLVRKAPPFEMPSEMLNALSTCRWPGRAQVFRHSSNLVYYLDGAHSPESMRHCVTWFRQMTTTSNSSEKFRKALIFNVIGFRDVRRLMEYFLNEKLDYVFFCCNRTAEQIDNRFDNVNTRSCANEEYERIRQYRRWWLELSPFDDEKVELFRHVNAAHDRLESLSSSDSSRPAEYHVLVTGSLHLVGAFLQLLDPELRRSLEVS